LEGYGMVGGLGEGADDPTLQPRIKGGVISHHVLSAFHALAVID